MERAKIIRDETFISDEEMKLATQLEIAECKKKLVEHGKYSAFEVQNATEKLIKLLKLVDEKHELEMLIISTLLRHLDAQDAGTQQRAARSLADIKHSHPKGVLTLIHYYFNPTKYLPYTPHEAKDLCRKALVQLGYKLDKLSIVVEALTNNNFLMAIVQCQIEITERYLSALPLPEDIKINCKKIVNRQLMEANSIDDGILYNQTLAQVAPYYYIFFQNLACYEHAAAQQSQSHEERQNLLQRAENNFKKSIELNSSTGTLVEYGLFLVVNQRCEEAKRYLSALPSTDTTLGYSYATQNTLTDILKTIVEENIEIKISAITLACYLLMECHYHFAQAKSGSLRTTDYAQIRLNFNKLKKQLETTSYDFSEQLVSLIQEKFSIALPKAETKPVHTKIDSSSQSKSPYISHAEQVIVIQGDIKVSGTNQIHGFFANKFEQSSSITSSNSSAQDQDNTNVTLSKN